MSARGNEGVAASSGCRRSGAPYDAPHMDEGVRCGHSPITLRMSRSRFLGLANVVSLVYTGGDLTSLKDEQDCFSDAFHDQRLHRDAGDTFITLLIAKNQPPEGTIVFSWRLLLNIKNAFLHCNFIFQSKDLGSSLQLLPASITNGPAECIMYATPGRRHGYVGVVAALVACRVMEVVGVGRGHSSAPLHAGRGGRLRRAAGPRYPFPHRGL